MKAQLLDLVRRRQRRRRGPGRKPPPVRGCPLPTGVVGRVTEELRGGKVLVMDEGGRGYLVDRAHLEVLARPEGRELEQLALRVELVRVRGRGLVPTLREAG